MGSRLEVGSWRNGTEPGGERDIYFIHCPTVLKCVFTTRFFVMTASVYAVCNIQLCVICDVTEREYGDSPQKKIKK